MRNILNVADASDERQLAVLGFLFGNLEAASRKTMRPNLARAFQALARSCTIQSRQTAAAAMEQAGRDEILEELLNRLVAERKGPYSEGLAKAREAGDRGVLRSFTWGQKVTAIQASLLKRFLKSPDDFFKEGETVHICEACGFVAVRGEAPERCPICNAPSGAFHTP